MIKILMLSHPVIGGGRKSKRKVMLYLLKPFVHDVGDVIACILFLTLIGAALIHLGVGEIKRRRGSILKLLPGVTLLLVGVLLVTPLLEFLVRFFLEFL